MTQTKAEAPKGLAASRFAGEANGEEAKEAGGKAEAEGEPEPGEPNDPKERDNSSAALASVRMTRPLFDASCVPSPPRPARFCTSRDLTLLELQIASSQTIIDDLLDLDKEMQDRNAEMLKAITDLHSREKRDAEGPATEVAAS